MKVKVHKSTNGCLKWRVGYINISDLRIATDYVHDHGWLFKNNFYVKKPSVCTTIWRGQSTNAYMNAIQSLNGDVYVAEPYR